MLKNASVSDEERKRLEPLIADENKRHYDEDNPKAVYTVKSVYHIEHVIDKTYVCSFEDCEASA